MTRFISYLIVAIALVGGALSLSGKLSVLYVLDNRDAILAAIIGIIIFIYAARAAWRRFQKWRARRRSRPQPAQLATARASTAPPPPTPTPSQATDTGQSSTWVLVVGALVWLNGLLLLNYFYPSLELGFLYLLLGIAAFGRFVLEQRHWGPAHSALASKEAKQIRAIAWRYQVKVSGKAGNTWGRVAFFGGFTLFIGYVLIRLERWTNLPLTAEVRLTGLIGSWVMLVLLSLPAFVAVVPKLAAIIVTNLVTGRMHVLTPGFNIRYPWEIFLRKIDQLSQRAGEVGKKSTFLSKDGVHVNFSNWVVQWGPFLPLLPLNIRYEVDGKEGAEAARVSSTISEIVESTLYQEVLGRDVKGGPGGLRDPQVVDDIETSLLRALAEPNFHKGDKFGSSIEERNGIIVEIAALGPVSFNEDYEQALVARQTVAMMREDAKQLATDLGIEGSQALDSVMIANKETVTRDIKKLEIDKNIGDALAGFVEGIRRGISRVASDDRRPQ